MTAKISHMTKSSLDRVYRLKWLVSVDFLAFDRYSRSSRVSEFHCAYPHVQNTVEYQATLILISCIEIGSCVETHKPSQD